MEASCNSGTCNAGGSRDTVQVSWVEFAVLDDPIIPPPTLDTVSVVNSTALEINFTAPVDLSNILSYDIRRFNGTAFETVGNLLNGTSPLSFVDAGLISDTFYRYHVVSVGSSAESVPSNEIGQRTTVILFSARPDSNPSVRWVNGLGNPPCGDLTTFECVNEVVRDDNDFIQTTALGTSNIDTDIMTLSNIDDPKRSDSHFLKYTVREAGVGTNPVEFEIQLRQGASIIASFTHSSLPTFYTLFSQELNVTATNSITDYNDLEITLIGRCDDAGCDNQERERFNVSFIVFEIELVKTGKISSIDTISPTTLRISWQNDDLDAEITNIIIQKENGTDFTNIGTVSNTIFAFNDTGLQEQNIFNYRITGQITNGFALPSLTLTGATPPSTLNLNGNGTILESNSTNSFTVLESGVIAQTIELFNVNSTSMQLILNDIDSQKLNAYQIINKMNNGSYDNTSKMRNAGAFYGNIYLEILDIDQFISDIAQRIIDEVNEG